MNSPDSKESNSQTEASPAEPGFQAAARLVNELGTFAAMFTSCLSRIHATKQLNYGQNPGRLRDYAIGAVSNLVEHSPSLKAMFINALPVLKNLPALPQEPGTQELLSHFSADEISSLIATTFLSSKVRQHCPPEIWQDVLPDMLRSVEIGFMLGKIVHRIGPGPAILIPAVRHLACAVFARGDPAGFREYRAHLKQARALFDPAEEERRWRCNHLQIASLLLQKVGYGHQAGEGLALAVEPAAGKKKAAETASFSEAEWHMALVWIERIQVREDWLQDITYRGEEIAAREVLVELKRSIAALPEHPARFAFLTTRHGE